MKVKNGMRPVQPDEVLREEYLKPLGLSANALAKALRLSPSRSGDIVLRTAERSAETKRALREIEPLEHSAA